MATSGATGTSYSSSDPGFAMLSVDEILAPHDALIARIKLAYGLDRADFERDVLRIIRRYAAYVHLLPATPTNYFNTPGGLLRLGLETGFFSLQGTDAHIFSGRATIQARRQLEPRWRHATFVAGLCCEIHRTFSHIIVSNDQGDTWPGYLAPLTDWLDARGSQRYFVRWRPQAVESRGLGLFALPLVVPANVLQYLAEENAIIVTHMMASIGGLTLYRDHNILDSLVRRSLALVVDRDLIANADRYGTPQFGSHLERYLVDAMRRLANGTASWIPNREKSRVWFGRDGLFLLWPNAAEDMHRLLEADQLPGIPKAPETMLELLLAAGVLEASDANRGLWDIRPPGAKAPLEAVRLTAPEVLFAGIDPTPEPLALDLAAEPAQASLTPIEPVIETPLRQTQLPLQAVPGEPPAIAPVAATTAPPPDASQQPANVSRPFTLRAPMRLNPAVRDAIVDIVQTLNDASRPDAAKLFPDGLFVPLGELAQRHIQPAIAARALSDARMLVQQAPDSPLTTTRAPGDETIVGLIIAPSFIDGPWPAPSAASNKV